MMIRRLVAPATALAASLAATVAAAQPPAPAVPTPSAHLGIEVGADPAIAAK